MARINTLIPQEIMGVITYTNHIVTSSLLAAQMYTCKKYKVIHLQCYVYKVH